VSECQRENPLCLKNGNGGNAKFCAVCGVAATEISRVEESSFVGSSGGGVAPSAKAPSNQSFNVQMLRSSLLATLTAQKTRRGDTSPNTVIQTIGGLLVGFGLIFFILDIWTGDGGQNTGGATVAAAIGLGLLVFLAIKVQRLSTAATAAANPVIPYTGLIMFASMIDEGQLFLPLLVIGVLYALAWFLPGFCGRQSMLAGAVLFISLAVVSLSAQSYLSDLIEYGAFADYLVESWQGVVERLFLLSTLVGVALIAVAWRLHLKTWEALATVFIAVGVLQGSVGIIGYISAAEFGNFGGSLLLTIFSVFLLSVGITTGRKATTWIAVSFSVLTIFGMIVAMTGDNADPVSVSLLLVVAGGVIAYFLSNTFGGLLKKIPFVQNAANKGNPIP